jgi:hypothetical protein
MFDRMLQLMGLAGREVHEVRGLLVHVVNTRPDIRTADVLARLDRAIGLLEQHVPWHARRLRRDFSRLLVVRYPCRGAYDHNDGTCVVELTFCASPQHGDPEVAATILHEAMHAPARRGLPLEFGRRARQERFCRRAEIEFGRVVPRRRGGARARGSTSRSPTRRGAGSTGGWPGSASPRWTPRHSAAGGRHEDPAMAAAPAVPRRRLRRGR